MLNWWSNLDIRGRLLFTAAFSLVAGIVFLVATGAVVDGLFITSVTSGVVGLFCPKDDSTKI